MWMACGANLGERVPTRRMFLHHSQVPPNQIREKNEKHAKRVKDYCSPSCYSANLCVKVEACCAKWNQNRYLRRKYLMAPVQSGQAIQAEIKSTTT